MADFETVHDALDHTGLTGVGASGELAYVEFTSDVTITATSEGSADTVVSAGAVSFDGSTKVKIEFYCASVELLHSALNSASFWLFDGSSSIGLLAYAQMTTGNASWRWPVKGERYLTPSAGSHTYSIRATRSAGTVKAKAGAGGSATTMPGFIRIVPA